MTQEAFLHSVDETTRYRRKTEDCSGETGYYLCSGLDAYYEVDEGCSSARCSRPECVSGFTGQRARRARQGIDSLLNKYNFTVLNEFSLTMPAEYRSWAFSEPGAFRKACWEFCLRFLQDAGITSPDEQGGYIAIHPEGDTPSDGPELPHIHAHCLVVSNVSFVSETQLDLLRWRWKNILQMFTGRYINGNVDLDYQYAREPALMNHRLKYCLRHWPGWKTITRSTPFGCLSPRGSLEREDTCSIIVAEPQTCEKCGSQVTERIKLEPRADNYLYFDGIKLLRRRKLLKIEGTFLRVVLLNERERMRLRTVDTPGFYEHSQSVACRKLDKELKLQEFSFAPGWSQTWRKSVKVTEQRSDDGEKLALSGTKYQPHLWKSALMLFRRTFKQLYGG